jgi:hypothetical protein
MFSSLKDSACLALQLLFAKTPNLYVPRYTIVQAVQGQGGVIVGVREETKVVQKPVGLNTVTLLKACSKGKLIIGCSVADAEQGSELLFLKVK